MQRIAIDSISTNIGSGPHMLGLSALKAAGSVDTFRKMSIAAKTQNQSVMAAAGVPMPIAAAPLATEEHELLDDMVIDVAKEQLQLTLYLRQNGMVEPVPGWLGVPEIKHKRVSRSGSAHRGMVPAVKGESFRVDYSFVVQPLFATFEMFELDIRTLESSRRLGMPLDLENGKQAVYNVNYAVEDQVVNGVNFNLGANASYGALTAPNANTVSYSGSNAAWDHASKTGKEITDDVKTMATNMQGDETLDGPVALAIEPNYMIGINDKQWSDGTTTMAKNVYETIRDKNYGGAPVDILQADLLPDDRTVMFRKDKRHFRLLEGQTATPITWSDPTGMANFTMIVACQVGQPMDSYDGQSGFVTGNV